MTIYLVHQSDCLLLRARAESEDGNTRGDLRIEIRPGESALGLPYEEWAKLRNGPHEILIDDDRRDGDGHGA